MSVSILTLSPTFLVWKFVISIVWGINETDANVFFMSTTVKLIPSIAIDPFFTTYFAKFLGTSK